MRKNIFRTGILVGAISTVLLLFQNMNPNDPRIASIKQQIRFLNIKMIQFPGNASVQRNRKAIKHQLLQTLAAKARVVSCAELKRLEPSAHAGFYQLYANSTSATPDLVDCVFDSTGNVLRDAVLVSAASVRLPTATNTLASRYYQTVTLQANGTSTRVRTAFPGIIEIARVVPTSANTPCPVSDYGFDAAGIWVKDRCAGQFILLTANGTRYLNALYSSGLRQLKGGIGSVRLLPGKKLKVTGWACEVGTTAPIETQLYFGDAASGGVFISAKLTGSATGESVSDQCETQNAEHGFEYTIDLVQNASLTTEQKATLRQWTETIQGDAARNKLFMYAVNHRAQGFTLQRLAASGTIPVLVPNQIGDVMGSLNNAVVQGGQLVVTGWSCHRGYTRQIRVKVYRNYPAGRGGILIGQDLADITHEAGVSNKCLGGGTAHRYSIRLPVPSQSLPSNAPLYAYGISTVTGVEDAMLANSGHVKIPIYAGSPPLCTPQILQCRGGEILRVTTNGLGCRIRSCHEAPEGSGGRD